jgi:hypothetical protein
MIGTHLFEVFGTYANGTPHADAQSGSCISGSIILRLCNQPTFEMQSKSVGRRFHVRFSIEAPIHRARWHMGAAESSDWESNHLTTRGTRAK